LVPMRTSIRSPGSPFSSNSRLQTQLLQTSHDLVRDDERTIVEVRVVFRFPCLNWTITQLRTVKPPTTQQAVNTCGDAPEPLSEPFTAVFLMANSPPRNRLSCGSQAVRRRILANCNHTSSGSDECRAWPFPLKCILVR